MKDFTKKRLNFKINEWTDIDAKQFLKSEFGLNDDFFIFNNYFCILNLYYMFIDKKYFKLKILNFLNNETHIFYKKALWSGAEI